MHEPVGRPLPRSSVFRFDLNQQTHHLLPPQLGLAHIAHLKGNHDEAQAGLELVMAEFSEQVLDGLGDPFGFYWLCHTLLEFYDHPLSGEVLQQAHQQLQTQANKIPDLRSRESFLNNVPENRLIIEKFSRLSFTS